MWRSRSQRAREGVRENRQEPSAQLACTRGIQGKQAEAFCSAKAKLGERGVQSSPEKRRQEHIIRRTAHVRKFQMSRTALGVIPYLTASCAHSRQCRCACAAKRRLRRTSRFAHVTHLAVSRAWSAHAHLVAHCVPLDAVTLQLEDLCCTLGRNGCAFHSRHGRDVHGHVQLLRPRNRLLQLPCERLLASCTGTLGIAGTWYQVPPVKYVFFHFCLHCHTAIFIQRGGGINKLFCLPSLLTY